MATIHLVEGPVGAGKSTFAAQSLTCDLIDTGTSAVLELGLVQRQDREDLYSRVDASGYELKVYLLDAPEEVRRARVRTRNEQRGDTFQVEVPDEFFELASRMWQAPDEVECSERDVRFV